MTPQETIDALLRAGWNQTQIARALDVSRGAITRWKRGERALHDAAHVGLLELLKRKPPARLKTGRVTHAQLRGYTQALAQLHQRYGKGAAAEVARLAGVKPGTARAYLRGARTPSAPAQRALIAAARGGSDGEE
jgi:transcriptional regulator with XRE-family HTH domain